MTKKKKTPPTIAVVEGANTKEQQQPTDTPAPDSSPGLRDPFNPKTGEFAENIRQIVEGDATELTELMRRFGWIAEFPAIVDENDVVLVGHRRLKIAKELGIEPVVKKLVLGTGDEADVERLKLAIISNIGSKPMTRDDRKHIAKYLYGSREWTMERIAEALNVSQRTISEDLRNLEVPSKSKPTKTATNPKGAGRPKGGVSRKVNISTPKKAATRIKRGAHPELKPASKTANFETAEASAAERKLQSHVDELEAEVRQLRSANFLLKDENAELKAKVERLEAEAASREAIH